MGVTLAALIAAGGVTGCQRPAPMTQAPEPSSVDRAVEAERFERLHAALPEGWAVTIERVTLAPGGWVGAEFEVRNGGGQEGSFRPEWVLAQRLAGLEMVTAQGARVSGRSWVTSPGVHFSRPFGEPLSLAAGERWHGFSGANMRVDTEAALGDAQSGWGRLEDGCIVPMERREVGR